MSLTADDLLAFQAAKRHGGLRKAEAATGFRPSDLIKRRDSVAASLNKVLSAGKGPGWQLTADGQALYDWIDSFPGGVALAAHELNTRGWNAVQPTSSASGAQGPPVKTAQPFSAGSPASIGASPSGSRIKVQLPEHPILASLVTSAIAGLPHVAATFHLVPCGPWPAAIESLLMGEVHIAFGWSPGERPEGYPPSLKAERLMPDQFDHAIERTDLWHRVLPKWMQRKRASIMKLRKHPMIVHGRHVQAALHKHVVWLAGRKWMIELCPPSDKHRLNAWTLASRFSTIVGPGEMIRPLDIIGLKAGLDVVYRANENRATALAIIAGTIARFSNDTGIVDSPVHPKFILSPSAQELAKV